MTKKKSYDILETINRTELLFRPHCWKFPHWQNPQHHQDPFKVSRGALKAKTTSRLLYLSQPKQETSECKALYAPKKPSKPFKGKFELSTRLIELSQPRPLRDDVQYNKSEFKSKKQWIQHLKRLETISAPRRTPPSPLENKRVKTSLQKILPRLETLSKPAYRPPNMNERTFEEMSTIKPSVLKYNASERILKLAAFKQYPEDLEMIKHKYNRRNATKYEATERTKKLSKPVFRPVPKMNEMKENPYDVDPKALKARCTPRLKKLARPIVRK